MTSGGLQFPWRLNRPLLVAICVAGLLLGSLVMSLTSFTVIDDEAIIGLMVDLPFRLMLQASPSLEHPPLFEILQWVWIRVVGNGVAARRAHSLIYVAIAMAVAWPMLVRCFGHTLAAYAFALTFASPFLFLFAHPAMWYMPHYAFLMVSMALLTRLLEGDWRRWIFTSFVAVNIGMVYLNYFSWVFFALYILHAVLSRAGWPVIRRLVGAHLLTAVAFLPLMPMFLGLAPTYTGIPWNLLAIGRRIAYFLFVLTVGESVPLSAWYLSLTAAVLTGFGIAFLLLRRHLPAGWFLFATVFGGALFIGSLFGVFETAKRATMLAGLYGILLGSLLGTAARLRPLLAGVLVLGLIGCWGISYSNLVSRRDFIAYRWVEPWPAVARFMAKELRAEDLVVNYHPSLDFYLRQEGIKALIYSPLDPSTLGVLQRHTVNRRVWYFRTAMLQMHRDRASLTLLEEFLKTHYRLAREQVLQPDPWAPTKRKLFPGHYYPDVRIHLFLYEPGQHP